MAMDNGSNLNHRGSTSPVSRAAYPVPPALTQILEESSSSTYSEVVISSFTDGEKALLVHQSLTHILENAIHALDQWYFATPPTLRSALVGHRTCLRISSNTSNIRNEIRKSITITDLGVGMTRADLINLLGVGRPIPPNYSRGAGDYWSMSPGGDTTTSSTISGASSSQQERSSSSKTSRQERIWNRKKIRQQLSIRSTISTSTIEEDTDDDAGDKDDDDDDDDVVGVGVGGVVLGEQELVVVVADDTLTTTHQHRQEEASSLQHSRISRVAQHHVPPKEVVGGFYSAVCALAVGVKVGTKSKHDDYYEFELGKVPNSSSSRSTGSWKEFIITRPLGEGRIPSIETEMTELTDVRGESGTSVTLYWHSSLNEWVTDEHLLPIITKILETTQYTFVMEGIVAKEELEALVMADGEGQDLLERQPHDDSNGGLAMMTEGSASSLLRPPQDDDDDNDNEKEDGASTRDIYGYLVVKERAKYIPVRLSLKERKLLRLVEAAMNCCDYTTRVDKPFSSPSRRLHQQIKGVVSILRGLVTACDYKAGQKLAQQGGDGDGDESSLWAPHREFLRNVLEITRRHKIMNPEKMRTEYGKLIYLLQDIVQLQQQGHLDYLFPRVEGESNNSLIAPIETVYKFLQDRNGLALLDDKYIELATEEILATPGKSRQQIEEQIQRKEKAVLILKQSHVTQWLSMEDIHMCLYSICDNNSFLNSNRVPIDKAIQFLEQQFRPDRPEPRFSLAIVHGTDGARLNHSHERQYYFALQSLTLWRDIVHDMFRLWAMAEDDLLSESVSYNLQDTGQGMHRIQQSPRTYQVMQEILKRVQARVQQWVGSSVVHLGDHNVPNALSFIDKYTQVPRILGPIVKCLENLESLCEEDSGIQDMIDEGFGGGGGGGLSLFGIKKEILHDFFRSAFDGSGADNNYDAGSCVDGRLTSSWNWCSQLPHKPYYPLFRLTGFTGFDGEFA